MLKGWALISELRGRKGENCDRLRFGEVVFGANEVS